MNIGFLAPLMLAGVIAIAVPVAIHLIGRRRARVVEFAALDFLLATKRRTAKRLRLRGGTVVSSARSPHATNPTLSCCWITRYASAASTRPAYSSLRMPPPANFIDADASSTR